MKINIERDVLIKELQQIQGIIEKKTTIPILSNLLMKTVDEGIEIFATDLDVGIKCKISDVSVESKGSITVNAKKIHDLIRSLPAVKLFFEVKEGKNLNVSGPNIDYNILVLPAEDYPAITFSDMQNSVELPLEGVRESITKTIFASAIDDTRYTLNGIFTQIMKDGLNMVASDAHRLSLFNISQKIGLSADKQEFIIPRKGAQEILNLIRDKLEKEKLKFLAEGNHIFFQYGPRLLSMRIIEGKYPQYEKVIPKENDKILTVNKAELHSALSRILLVANEVSHAIELNIDEKELKISSSSPEFGRGEEILKGEYQGENIRISFNAKYILDFLNVVQSENIVLKFRNENTAGLFMEDGNDSFQYIVSPIKL